VKASKTSSSDFVLGGFPLIEFARKPIDPDLLVGFVLGGNDDLVFVHLLHLDVFRLNGYAIFRNSDVKWWRPVAEDDFRARAARLHRLRPSKPANVAFGSMRQALESAGQEFPLITIHRERTDRGACYIGKFLRTSQRVLTIRYISPQAPSKTLLF
jgi:hypothetical protein